MFLRFAINFCLASLGIPEKRTQKTSILSASTALAED
jgi:hypothetical protein